MDAPEQRLAAANIKEPFGILKVEPATQTVHITIDGHDVDVPKNTLLWEAARQAGIDIPIFCYHSKLGPVGVCRMCMVEIEGQPKLTTACTTAAGDGMVVYTRSPEVEKAQRGVLDSFSSTIRWTALSATAPVSALCRTRRFTTVRESAGSSSANVTISSRFIWVRPLTWIANGVFCAGAASGTRARWQETTSSS